MGFFPGGTEFPDDIEKKFEEDEREVLDKLARKVVEWQMTAPSIIFLESVRPLNYIGSQTMVFFEPIIQGVFAFKDYDTLRLALEKRESIEFLIRKIEEHDAVRQARDKRIKKYRKEQKKHWKWYQRYLGIFQPRLEYPDWVIYGEEEAAKRKAEKEEDWKSGGEDWKGRGDNDK